MFSGDEQSIPEDCTTPLGITAKPHLFWHHLPFYREHPIWKAKYQL